MILDLTEDECSYELPPDIEKLAYPIPDFSFKAFESVLVDVVLPALSYLRAGNGVLIHCKAGIGRSGTTVSMITSLREGLGMEETLNRMLRLGYFGVTPAQELALRWFFRARDLIGVDRIVELVNILKSVRKGAANYWSLFDDHASTVAGVALDVLEAISEDFGVVVNDLLCSYVAGLFHDVGRVLERDEDKHHEVGANFVKSLREVGKWCNLDVVAKAVLHHRRRTDLLGDSSLSELGSSAQLIASALRLADAFKNAYQGDGVYLRAEKRGSELVLLLNSSAYGQVSYAYLSWKAEAFSKLTGLKVKPEIV